MSMIWLNDDYVFQTFYSVRSGVYCAPAMGLLVGNFATSEMLHFKLCDDTTGGDAWLHDLVYSQRKAPVHSPPQSK